MISSQMLKGTLEGCVLLIISRRETYGYEIAETLMRFGFGKVAEGTIYPLLLRLERNGLVLTEYRPSELGPRRKYYRLSEATNEILTDIVVYIRCANISEYEQERVRRDIYDMLLEGERRGRSVSDIR